MRGQREHSGVFTMVVALCRQGAEEDDVVVCNHLCVDACMYLYMQTYACTVACVDTNIRIISVGVCFGQFANVSTLGCIVRHILLSQCISQFWFLLSLQTDLLRGKALHWALIFFMSTCCAPARSVGSEMPVSLQRDGGTVKHGTGGMAGGGAAGGGLLRAGIVSAMDLEKHDEQKAMLHAAQQLRMPPVQAFICRLPTEAMAPLQDDDDADATQHSASAQASAAATNALVPDLGFVTVQQKEEENQTLQTSPWLRRFEETTSKQPSLGQGGGGGFASNSQMDRDGGWQWSGGGVGGSPIKKGAAAAASKTPFDPIP